MLRIAAPWPPPGGGRECRGVSASRNEPWLRNLWLSEIQMKKPTKHMVLINIYYMYFTIFYPHYWWIWWLRNREVAYCHVVIDDISGSDCLILSGKWGQRCTVWGDKWDVVFAGTLQLRTPWVRCMWELLRLHLLYPGTFPYLSEMSPGVDANGSTILELGHPGFDACESCCGFIFCILVPFHTFPKCHQAWMPTDPRFWSWDMWSGHQSIQTVPSSRSQWRLGKTWDEPSHYPLVI